MSVFKNDRRYVDERGTIILIITMSLECYNMTNLFQYIKKYFDDKHLGIHRLNI